MQLLICKSKVINCYGGRGEGPNLCILGSSMFLCVSFLGILCIFWNSMWNYSHFPSEETGPQRKSGLSKLEQAPWSPDPQTIFHVLHLDCINSPSCVPSKQWVTGALGGREGMQGRGRGGLVDSQAVCAGKSHERHPQQRMRHQNKMYCI